MEDDLKLKLKMLGHNLKRVREDAGLNQTALADLAGVSRETVSNVERGNPSSIVVLFRLAKVLSISVEELLHGQSK